MNSWIRIKHWNYDLRFNVRLELNGGMSDQSSITAVVGKEYQFLPVPEKIDNIFEGWYSDQNYSTRIIESDQASYNVKTLYAKWKEIDFSHGTWFQVEVTNTTTTNYNVMGLYAGDLDSESDTVWIDWGDGNIESMTSIYRLNHGYESTGTYVVKVSNDLTTIATSTNDRNYYNFGRYCMTKILRMGDKITKLPDYAFYHADVLSEAHIGELTTIGNGAFSGCIVLNQIWCDSETAPMVQSATFGSTSTTQYSTATVYTGYNTRQQNNTLYVPVPSNYQTSYWNSVLFSTSRCNFKVQEYHKEDEVNE